MPDVTLEISSDTLGPAFQAWAAYQTEVRGKALMEVVQRAMQYLVSFAMREIEEKKPGNAALVERQLMALSHDTNRVSNSARARLRGGKTGSKYRNTMAARIVFMLNYRGARLKAAFGDDAGAYNDVATFVKARRYSVRHHKVSGFLPALAALASTGRGRRAPIMDRGGPRYKNAPGAISQTLTAHMAEILVEAWPSAAQRPGRPAPLGLSRLVPGAFTDKLDDLQTLFLRFAMEDGLLTMAAERAGFINLGSRLAA